MVFVIAMDGPAAAGKSTVGRAVADRLGYLYFDTGLLYRALTFLALQRGVAADDAAALGRLAGAVRLQVDDASRVRIFAGDEDVSADARLHQPAVDAAISAVAAHAEVRTELRPAQRAAIVEPGVVLAGRDIGSVIAPEAQLKVWLSAGAEERARRRSTQTGEPYTAVLEAMRRRDALDGSRAVAPMQRAADALDVETDGLTAAAVANRIVQLASERGARPAGAGVEA